MKHFLDVGANVGQTFRDHLIPNVDRYQDFHIYCFEPSPRHLDALRSTADQNVGRFRSVSVIPAAVWRRVLLPTEELVEFHVKTQPLADSIFSEWRQNRAHGSRLLVPMLDASRLPSILGIHWSSEIELKLDVEGAEYGILSAIIQTPENWVALRKVWVEWHHIPGVTEPGLQQEDLIAGLRKRGVEVETWPF